MNIKWKQTLGKVLVLVLCAAIAVCSISVLLFAYSPNRNSLGALASVCMDVVCMAIGTVLVVNTVLERKTIDRTTKLFLALMVGTMWALFLDFLTWSSDGNLDFNDMTYVYTVGSLCMGSVLAFIFVLYLGSYMVDVYELKSAIIRSRICAICNLIAFLVTFTLAITKTAFSFEGGHYSVGALYDFVTAIPVLTLVYMTIFAIRNCKTIGFHDIAAVAGYICIMICGALIEAEYSIGTSYVGITIADVFIFVMLQNKIIDKEQRAAENWRRKSNTDDLTGFYNRHAYEDEIKMLDQSPLPEDFVYVSIDINGLKVVNDSLGHNAGDDLIMGACECMRCCFGPYGKLFRTGGDEFVAIITAKASDLESIQDELKTVTGNWVGRYVDSLSLSCGFVTRDELDGMSLHQAAVLADKRMYAAKTNYYRTKGIDRRGQRDAHVALCALYTKICKINITEDSFQIINGDSKEQTEEFGFGNTLSEWFEGFVATGMVHPDDADEFKSKMNNEFLNSYFTDKDKMLRLFYRRKDGNGFKRCMTEIITAGDFREDLKTLFVYVKETEKKEE